MPDFFVSSVFVSAVVFGFRHGFDWDHIAALTDLTGSQQTPRRSMVLATLYALGHAAMVLLLGLVAILFADELPSGVDTVMERFVGVTLIALGIYIAWSILRRPGQLPVRSRWMLVLTAVRRVLRRWRQPKVVIEHSHPHDHGGRRHGHEHPEPRRDHADLTREGALELAVQHSHAHRHVVAMPSDPFMAYTAWSALGIGVLHGIGAETPTQLLIFAAAANAGGRLTSVGLLVCFIVGILGANTVVAAAGAYGFIGVSRRRGLTIALSVVTATFSLVIGTVFLVGGAGGLPSILGG